MFELKSYRGVMCHDTERNATFQRKKKKKKTKKNGGLKNDIKNLVNFHTSSRKRENLHFIRLLLPITDKVSAIKSTEKLALMTQNFEEKLTFCLRNDMRNLVNFNASSGKA